MSRSSSTVRRPPALALLMKMVILAVRPHALDRNAQLDLVTNLKLALRHGLSFLTLLQDYPAVAVISRAVVQQPGAFTLDARRDSGVPEDLPSSERH